MNVMMHAPGDSNASAVPAFLHKLWTLVEDESTNDLICWDVSGHSFHVFDQGQFSKEVLPLYFKHNNIASFIRQLNMYGFRKVTHVDQGGLKIEKDDMEFTHQYFQRGNDGLLEHIKRKVATGKVDDVKVKHDDVNKVLMDVHQLRGKQEHINSKFDTLKRENEALWREVATLRQKHHKQQQIVNKLIQFLITIVGNRGLAGMKRPARMPLMLNDVGQLSGGTDLRPSKKARLVNTTPASRQTPKVGETSMKKEVGAQPSQPVFLRQTASAPGGQPIVLLPSVSGPASQDGTQTYIVVNQPQTVAISEVPSVSPSPAPPVSSSLPFVTLPMSMDSLESPQATDADLQGQTATIQEASSDFLGLGSPGTSGEEALLGVGSMDGNTSDFTLQAMGQALTVDDSTVAVTPRIAHESVSADVDTIHESLESLKDLLAGGANLNIDPSAFVGLQLDRDTLHGLFTPEAPVPPTPESLRLEPDYPKHIDEENQLVQYIPGDDFGTLFDLDLDPDPGATYGEDDQLYEDIEEISTPSLDLSSPLAQRRRMKRSPTEEVD